MRPIFCGNFEFDARASDLERLFRRYGQVEKIDMKSGFAFIHMEDERDAEYAIRALDRTEFGRTGRRLRVEWTKQERSAPVRKSASSRKTANLKPSKTLFVINFPYDTKTSDLERHFDPYGKIVNVRIRRNFAFVQYESQEDATKALNATDMSKMMGRVISVEYSARGDNDRKMGYSPDRRGRDRSPDNRRRSPSPYRRERGSPDYGTGSNPAPYRRERGSPDYGTGSSPVGYRRERGSPVYGRGSSRSPRISPSYERLHSPGPRRGGGRASSDYHDRSQSPRGMERNGNPYGRHQSTSPSPRRGGVRTSSDYRDRSRSPLGMERNGNSYGHHPNTSPSPRRGVGVSPDYRDRSRTPLGVERNGNSYGRRPSTTPSRDERGPADARELRSPGDRSDSREDGELESPVNERYGSRSPLARERSQS